MEGGRASSGLPLAPPARGPGLAVLGLIAAAAAFSVLVVGQRYWLDDSFISFRYARNLFEGGGLVYNPGERVEGYTNFLWTMVSYAGLSLSVEPIHFTQAVSVLAQALTLWALYQIGRAAGLRGWRPVLAPLFLATSIGFVGYPMTGMETSFFTMLLTLAFLLLLRRSPEGRGARAARGRDVLLGLVLLALALTRFDGFVPALLLLGYPLLLDRPDAPRRGLLLPIGILVAGLAVYNLWRLAYYGSPLPNSFYAKTSFSPARMVDGLFYLKRFGLYRESLAVALAMLPFALRRARPAALYAGWVVLGQTAYVVLVGADWMPHFRFLLPILPLLFVLTQEGWWLAADALAERIPSPRASAAAVLSVLLAFHVAPLFEGIDFTDLSGKHFAPHDARLIGEYLDEHLPHDRLIAVEWGGILPYYTHHRVLDTWGLNDPEIVELDLPRTVYGRRLDPRYLAGRAPDLVAPCARLMPSEEAARASVRPGGPNAYSYYPRLAADGLGYEWRTFRIAEGAWWPALVRRAEAPAPGDQAGDQ